MKETENSYGQQYLLIVNGSRIGQGSALDRRQNINRNRLRPHLSQCDGQLDTLGTCFPHAYDPTTAYLKTNLPGPFQSLYLLLNGMGRAQLWEKGRCRFQIAMIASHACIPELLQLSFP